MPLLAQPQKRPDRLKMIEKALKDKNPAMYLQMKRSGKLPSFLSDQEEAMMESFLEAYSQSKFQILGPKGPKDYLETVRELNTAKNEAWNDALQTWLEFPTIEPDLVISTGSAAGNE